jgi:uncharacterized protein (DUF433 family)
MRAVQKCIRLSEASVKEIEALASSIGKDFSGMARDLLNEAVRIRRCPGIVFADGATGRRARIAGTGIDVWEFIATFKGLGENYDRLKQAYHWLSDQQIRSGLSYYALYRDDINEKITNNEDSSQEQILKRFPFLSTAAGRQ